MGGAPRGRSKNIVFFFDWGTQLFKQKRVFFYLDVLLIGQVGVSKRIILLRRQKATFEILNCCFLCVPGVAFQIQVGH